VRDYLHWTPQWLLSSPPSPHLHQLPWMAVTIASQLYLNSAPANICFPPHLSSLLHWGDTTTFWWDYLILRDRLWAGGNWTSTLLGCDESPCFQSIQNPQCSALPPSHMTNLSMAFSF
jgi:hypothetical protein